MLLNELTYCNYSIQRVLILADQLHVDVIKSKKLPGFLSLFVVIDTLFFNLFISTLIIFKRKKYYVLTQRAKGLALW